MCFFLVFFVFGREEKCAENIQAKRQTQKSLLFFFLGLKVPRAFYSPNMLFEGRHF